MIDTLFFAAFMLFKSETLTKSTFFANPRLESHVLREENEVGTVPEAISEAQDYLISQIRYPK